MPNLELNYTSLVLYAQELLSRRGHEKKLPKRWKGLFGKFLPKLQFPNPIPSPKIGLETQKIHGFYMRCGTCIAGKSPPYIPTLMADLPPDFYVQIYSSMLSNILLQ